MSDEYSDIFGPNVTLVRTLYTGDTVRQEMPAFVAMELALYDAINGGEVISSHIDWGDVSPGLWDRSA